MAVRVFISHSTGPKEGCEPIPHHAEFRKRVCKRLVDEGFDVGVDVDIEAGAPWRKRIFGRLDECDAAVVLVNRQALEHSPWVDFEMKILGWRAWIEEKHFRLVVVPFGGVTRSRLQQHPSWEALALGELQMVPGGDAGLYLDDEHTVVEALDKIVESLRKLPGDKPRQSVYGWVVDKLTCILDLEGDSLENVAAKVGVTGRHKPERLRREIALRFYEMGPKALEDLVKDHRTTIKDDALNTALKILSTYWVDPSASATILKYCGADASKQVFVINGEHHYFTPEAYVHQICCWLKPWPVIPVIGKLSTEEILGQITEKLYEELGTAVKERMKTGRSLEQCINDVINSRLKARAPVFVVLPPTAAWDSKLIEVIRKKFENLRIILCTGTPPGKDALPDFEMLKPEVDLKAEDAAYNEYFDALAIL